jgi:hypothetical protein
MVVYEVTLVVEPSVADGVERYLRGKHIPEILATGAFAAIRLERADGGVPGAAGGAAGPGARLRTRYEARTREEVEAYLRDHSPAFRADFATWFPTGVAAERAVWWEVESWG